MAHNEADMKGKQVPQSDVNLDAERRYLGIMKVAFAVFNALLILVLLLTWLANR